MQRKSKRLLSMWLAVWMVFAALGNFAAPVSAAQTDGAYVLRFDDAGKPYLYGSRYQCKHSYNDPEAGPNSVWTFWNAPEIFNLVYLSEDGEQSIPAYCTDADTSTVSDDSIYYRRINLEDSDYHGSGAAARLRAVLLHSFPYLSVETVAANVNIVLGEGTVQNLTQGELLSATQQAIWEITHGEKYTVNENYVSVRGMDQYDVSKFVYPESLAACVEGEFTGSNITNLYQYFLGLEGMGPIADAVSEFTFRDVVYDAVREEDGTYTVTVSYNLDTVLRDGDSLTFTAACGDRVQEAELAAGAGQVTFTELTQKQPVTLTVSGYQTGADVYLFDAQGDRGASQSMVGYDNTKLPVFAQVTAGPDRVIQIYKTTNEGENKRPLANIEFEIYPVATMDQLASGEVKLEEKPTDEQIGQYTAGSPIVTLKTDARGFAAFNLTENGCPDGVYLILEKENAAVASPIEPFFVAVPGTNEDGTGHEYTVTVHPKNTVETKPDIRKDVTEIDNDEDTFDVDQLHTWIIRSDIPAGMSNAVKYRISDSLDYRLKLCNGFEVKVGLKTDRAGEEAVTLIPGTDYRVTTGTGVDDAGNGIDTFVIELTQAGMKAAAAAAGSQYAEAELRVYFDAVIDSDAQLGVEIPNQAKLEYMNETGIEYESESDIPKVYTGGIGILKLDSGTGTALADASFKIAREATEAEIGAGESVMLLIGETEKQVVFVPFYRDAALTEKVSEATTGEDGKILMYGLAYGTYYIVETKAPEHYNLLTEPVAVEIGGESHLEESVLTVYNTKFLLPETGGMGTALFTVFGAAFIGGALILSFGCLRKKETP